MDQCMQIQRIFLIARLCIREWAISLLLLTSYAIHYAFLSPAIKNTLCSTVRDGVSVTVRGGVSVAVKGGVLVRAECQ
jgi:hypothetical protein